MRQTYKLLHWDYGTNKGIAVDGTSFDGLPVTFEVRREDLPEELNGHLIMDEVFSAYEDSAGDHHLFDILVEEGTRAMPHPLYKPSAGYSDEGAVFSVDDLPADPPQPCQIVDGLDVNRYPAIASLLPNPDVTKCNRSPSTAFIFIDDLMQRVESLEKQVAWLTSGSGAVYDDQK